MVTNRPDDEVNPNGDLIRGSHFRSRQRCNKDVTKISQRCKELHGTKQNRTVLPSSTSNEKNGMQQANMIMKDRGIGQTKRKRAGGNTIGMCTTWREDS